jgi:hypothetical protein
MYFAFKPLPIQTFFSSTSTPKKLDGGQQQAPCQ